MGKAEFVTAFSNLYAMRGKFYVNNSNLIILEIHRFLDNIRYAIIFAVIFYAR